MAKMMVDKVLSPPEPKAFDRSLGKHVLWSQVSALDSLSLARVTIELLRGIEWHQNGGGTYTCPAEGSWTFAQQHWEDCGLASVLAHAEATFAALNVPRKHRITLRRTPEELRLFVNGCPVGSVFFYKSLWCWTVYEQGDIGGLTPAHSDMLTENAARKAAVKHIRKCLRAYARTVRVESSPIGGFDILVGTVIVGNVREDRYHWWHWKIDPNPLGIEPRGWPLVQNAQEATLAAVRYVEAQLAAKESPK
jgi:hypothetical protein